MQLPGVCTGVFLIKVNDEAGIIRMVNYTGLAD
jgi:hypothetical protein